MTEIRSLADELREKMRTGQQDDEPATAKKNKTAGKHSKSSKTAIFPDPDIEHLLTTIIEFEPGGNEKLLIRLDSRTVFMLKQLKVTRGIDMNKLIAFSVAELFRINPGLVDFIKSTLQTIEL